MNVKIKTRRKLNENWIALDAHISEETPGSLRIITAFGVWARRDLAGRYYESDRFARSFKTLSEAKKYARLKTLHDLSKVS